MRGVVCCCIPVIRSGTNQFAASYRPDLLRIRLSISRLAGPGPSTKTRNGREFRFLWQYDANHDGNAVTIDLDGTFSRVHLQKQRAPV